MAGFLCSKWTNVLGIFVHIMARILRYDLNPKMSTEPEEAERTEEKPMPDLPKNKHELAVILLNKTLANGPVESVEIHNIMAQYRIGEKTLNEVRVAMGIKPYRKMRRWYWVLPTSNEGSDDE